MELASPLLSSSNQVKLAAIMKLHGKKLYSFLGLIVFLVLFDQLTKIWAKRAVQGQAPTIYWGDFFRFEYAENTGAFLSLGAGLSETWRFLLFTLLTGLFLGYSAYYLVKKELTTLGQLGFVLIIAGGIGNLIDRAYYGYVVDFMNMGIGNLRTGIFNVADMAIVGGILLLFFVKDPASANEASTEKTNGRNKILKNQRSK